MICSSVNRLLFIVSSTLSRRTGTSAGTILGVQIISPNAHSLTHASVLGCIALHGCPCQPPRVRFAHDRKTAGASSSSLGRCAKGCRAEAQERATERRSSHAARFQPRRAARHHARAAGSVEPSHASLLSGAAARPRTRLRPVRLPPHSLLRAGEPHPLHRRGTRPARAHARHEGPGGSHGPGLEPRDAPARTGVRRPLPRTSLVHPEGGAKRLRLRALELARSRGTRRPARSSRRRPLQLSRTRCRGNPPRGVLAAANRNLACKVREAAKPVNLPAWRTAYSRLRSMLS